MFRRPSGRCRGAPSDAARCITGLFISGASHVLIWDGNEAESRLAGNVLLWLQNDTTYRLEGDLDKGQMVELATQITR